MITEISESINLSQTIAYTIIISIGVTVLLCFMFQIIMGTRNIMADFVDDVEAIHVVVWIIIAIVVCGVMYWVMLGQLGKTYQIEGDGKLLDYDTEQQVATIQLEHEKQPVKLKFSDQLLFIEDGKSESLMQTLMNLPKSERDLHISKSKMVEKDLLKGEFTYVFEGNIEVKDKATYQKALSDYTSKSEKRFTKDS